MDPEEDFESDDSFFDDPRLSKKSQPTRKQPVEDIFGVQSDKNKDKSDNVKSGPSSLENVHSSPKPKVRFNLDEPKPQTKPKQPDWLLPDNPSPSKPTKVDAKKTFDLFDDFLPQRKKPEVKTTLDDILRDSKAQQEDKKPAETEVKPTISARPSTSSEVNVIMAPQGPRMGRRASSGVPDVLGLFGPSSSDLSSGVDEKKSGLPDWLAGTTSTTSTNNEPVALESELKPTEQPQPTTVQKSPSEPETQFQANMSNLQAQESFLLVSLQMKKYEESLSEIKSQQLNILKKQEDQYDLFLNKYIDKQKSIEQDMLAQQERINEHIRMMALRSFEGGSVQSKIKSTAKDGEEKSDLEKIIQSLKQRHNEEFFLMEESYKKQLSLLEKSSDQIEQRLKDEVESMYKLYEEKTDKLMHQQKEEEQFWSEKIKSIEEKHKQELEQMKENQTRVIGDIKNEFLDHIERIKEERSRHNEIFANSTDFSQKLNTSLDKLNRNEQVLEQIQEKVVNDYNILSIARERSIDNKEKDITAMRVALEKCREQAEHDRSQLLALVRTLEQKISEQNQNSQEERWALQQAAATFAARSAAFEREVEFSRTSIERERQQLKTLKEALLAEQEKITLHLTEEKLKLSAEKSRLEVSAKLVNNYEVEKVKTEAETAIQVAKELTEKLNIERNFVQRQKMELDSLRNSLLEKERDLTEKEDSLEQTKRNIQYKTNEDRRVIQEARLLETRCKERLAELQSQAMFLSNREKKLAEEKLALSKERVTLYSSAKDKQKCMLCRAEDDNVIQPRSEILLNPAYHTTDPDFVRLRMEAMEDELQSEVSKEDNTGAD